MMTCQNRLSTTQILCCLGDSECSQCCKTNKVYLSLQQIICRYICHGPTFIKASCCILGSSQIISLSGTKPLAKLLSVKVWLPSHSFGSCSNSSEKSILQLVETLELQRCIRYMLLNFKIEKREPINRPFVCVHCFLPLLSTQVTTKQLQSTHKMSSLKGHMCKESILG